MKNRNLARKFSTGFVAPSLFSLGVGSERKRNVFLSLSRSLTLSDLGEGSRGGPDQNKLSMRVGIGWDVTKEAHPASQRLAYSSQKRKTDCVDVFGDDDESIVTVGSQHTFSEKQRAARCNGYGTEAPDELHDRDNPGNEQVLDPATGHGVRVTGIRASVLNLSVQFQTLPNTKHDVAPSGKCQGTVAPMEKI